MSEYQEFFPVIKDRNGRQILPGSEFRLSEEGKKNFEQTFKSTYKELPNFRCKVSKIDNDGIIHAYPLEVPEDALADLGNGKTGKLADQEIPFLSNFIIVE